MKTKRRIFRWSLTKKNRKRRNLKGGAFDDRTNHNLFVLGLPPNELPTKEVLENILKQRETKQYHNDVNPNQIKKRIIEVRRAVIYLEQLIKDSENAARVQEKRTEQRRLESMPLDPPQDDSANMEDREERTKAQPKSGWFSSISQTGLANQLKGKWKELKKSKWKESRQQCKEKMNSYYGRIQFVNPDLDPVYKELYIPFQERANFLCGTSETDPMIRGSSYRSKQYLDMSKRARDVLEKNLKKAKA